MRNLVLAAITALVLSAPARAAQSPKAAAAPARGECASFRGAYLGVNAGVAQHDAIWVDRDAWVDNFSSDFAVGTVRTRRQGPAGGVQAGYNAQRGCRLIGAETDFSWASVGQSRRQSPATNGAAELELLSTLRWFGTVRARAGVIVDDMLLFVTAGAAYARIGREWSLRDVSGNESFREDANMRLAPVGGFGMEWAWSDSISIKADTLYARFSERASGGFSPNGPEEVHFDNRDDLWVGRVGVNYRFGR